MINVSFHKKLTLSLANKIEKFSQSLLTIGLHQVLLFSQAMEPTKKLEYCIAMNGNDEIEGYCIINKRFPIISIQDGPVSLNERIISDIISAIKIKYSSSIFAFTTIQLPYSQKDAIVEKVRSKDNSFITNVFSYPTWITIIIETTSSEYIEASFQKGNVGTNIRKAQKKGVHIDSSISEKTINEFANLYDSTYKNRDIQKQWKNSHTFFTALVPHLKTDNGFFIGAYFQDKMVAGGIFFASGNTLYYKYGASNRTLKGIPLMHSIIHQAVLLAKDRGYSFLDLCGINPEAPEGSQVHAITMFKKGFGGSILRSPERIYLTNNRITLAFVLLLLKFKRLIHK
jgi:hypothetical protein